MSADSSRPRVDIELGGDVFALIEALYGKHDAQSLALLHTILAKLIMSHIQDTKTSFVDLTEYCQSLILALGGSQAALNESKSLRALITHDLGLPDFTDPTQD